MEKHKQKSRWLICIKSYEIDGIEIPKGRMDYTNCRFPVSGLWELASEQKINGKKLYKGNWFNLN